MHQLPANKIFSTSRTQDKTKSTLKEYQYGINSKENAVWSKWQPQLLLMCGLKYIKNVTRNKRHGWHPIHLSQNINNLWEVWSNFIRNRFAMGSLSSILDVLVNVFYYNKFKIVSYFKTVSDTYRSHYNQFF